MWAPQEGLARTRGRKAGLRATIVAAMLAFGGAAGAQDAGRDGGFVTEIPDLPLMPGLTELAEAGIAFDKPSGRIVEAYAQGAVKRAAVLSFYRKSLPQLGWAPDGERGYARDGEKLTIEVIDDAAPLTLRFSLRPE